MPLDERPKVEPSRGVAASHPAGRSGCGSVVDDGPNVRLVFRTALESGGFLAPGPAAIDLRAVKLALNRREFGRAATLHARTPMSSRTPRRPSP